MKSESLVSLSGPRVPDAQSNCTLKICSLLSTPHISVGFEFTAQPSPPTAPSICYLPGSSTQVGSVLLQISTYRSQPPTVRLPIV
jgi:hypothetical protein